MRTRRRTVISGGGTGGHIVPSLQIARALVERGQAAETIELYGSRRGQEATTWPTLEFPYALLPGRGIRRSLGPAALWANAGAILGLAWASIQTLASFVLRRPRVVVMVGGYASFPAGLSAVLTRVPLVSVTTDAVPGAANRLLGRFAVANAVAFDGTNLPRAHLTGTPVRPEIRSIDRSPKGTARGRNRLGLPTHRQTVVAVGGSLGALTINRAVADLARGWSGGEGRSLYHVTGRRDFDSFVTAEAGHEPLKGNTKGDECCEPLCYRVVPFEEHMDELYAAADVCIARAGAITVAELLISGVPAILVPLPGAPGDHQTRNAEALARFGAAVVVPDNECDATRLASELDALLADAQRLRAMSDAALQHGHPEAAERVAELVHAHAE